jgi:hypothetical protein
MGMQDGLEEDRQAYAAVDEALRHMQAAPPGFSAAVLARIQAQTAPALPRFRITWLDAALSLFAAAMIGLAWLLTATLPPVLTAQLRNQALYWLQSARIAPWQPIVLLGGSLLGGAGLGLVLSALFTVRRT